MDFSLIVTALQLAAYLSGAAFAALLLGAATAGILRVATQIDDQSIGLAGRLAAAVVALYLGGSWAADQIADFTLRIWGGADFYY